MKTAIVLLCLVFLTLHQTWAQTEFKLEPSQSMLMTGKGPGQDATINPFAGEDCFAIVENIGTLEFSIRIQKQGRIIDTIPISKGEIKKITLLRGQELYLDPNPSGIARAKVDYERITQ